MNLITKVLFCEMQLFRRIQYKTLYIYDWYIYTHIIFFTSSELRLWPELSTAIHLKHCRHPGLSNFTEFSVVVIQLKAIIYEIRLFSTMENIHKMIKSIISYLTSSFYGLSIYLNKCICMLFLIQCPIPCILLTCINSQGHRIMW